MTEEVPERARAEGVSRSRKRLFATLLVAIVYVAIEALSFVAFWIVDREPFRFSRIRSERERAIGEPAIPTGEQGQLVVRPSQFMVLHPYLGYVMDPIQAQQGLVQFVNDFGFAKTRPGPIFERAKDRVVIGIVGGSVAQILAYNAELVLQPHLEQAGGFAGKEIVFVVLANGGYKQPQQLMTIAYLLAMGGELDAVVNVDGVNDVSLPVFENIPNGVHPLFPRDWSGLVGGLRNPRSQVLAGRASFLKQLKGGWARTLGRAPFRYSVTLQFLWRGGDRWLESRAARSLAAARALDGEGQPFYLRGPEFPISDEEQIFEELAAAWKRASLQLQLLCQSNGIQYLHFLQPNQYVVGSKPMSDDERRIALNPASPFKDGVEKGYPLLQRDGHELTAEGVSFHDLTGLFATVREPVYGDDCCHLNWLGNQLLGERVAAELARLPFD